MELSVRFCQCLSRCRLGLLFDEAVSDFQALMCLKWSSSERYFCFVIIILSWSSGQLDGVKSYHVPGVDYSAVIKNDGAYVFFSWKDGFNVV